MSEGNVYEAATEVRDAIYGAAEMLPTTLADELRRQLSDHICRSQKVAAIAAALIGRGLPRDVEKIGKTTARAFAEEVLQLVDAIDQVDAERQAARQDLARRNAPPPESPFNGDGAEDPS